MPRMKVVQVAKPNAGLEIVERAGWPSGTAPDSEDTLKFGVQSNVRPMIETFPLAKAAEAYQRMMSGKARFRVVLVP